MELDAESLPLSAAALAAAKALRTDPLDWALAGGEDYELLFTVPERKMRAVMEKMPAETGAKLAIVGRVVKRKGLRLRRGGRLRPLEPKGYRHF